VIVVLMFEVVVPLYVVGSGTNVAPVQVAKAFDVL
jgi:hypothetical protein